MNDKEMMALWKRIHNPKRALREIVDNENFLGYDPYYADLRKALLDMAERCAKHEQRK